MTQKTKEEINKDLLPSRLNPLDQSHDETTQQNDTVQQEELRNAVSTRGDESSREDGRGPGAYAMPGIHASLSSSHESLSQQDTADNNAQPDTIPQLSAELVDEAAEEQRRQEYEQERLRNRELENYIRQMQSDAVVAIPVTIQDNDRPKSGSHHNARLDCFRTQKSRKWFAGGLTILVVAAVLGSILSVMLGDGGDERPTAKRDSPTNQPTSEPPRRETPSPTTHPTTNPPTASPTRNVHWWNQMGQTLEGKAAGDLFGFSVALSADGTVVAGGGTRNVQVFYYDSRAQLWKQLGPDLNGMAANDQFGTSVALSGDGSVVAAGAARMNNSDRKGYIQVHAFNNMTGFWNQVGQDVQGRNPGDLFGSSIAMSADGDVIAAGGLGRSVGGDESSSGNQTGYVRVFAFNSNASLWTQMGQDLIDADKRYRFGRSVAVSAAGKVVAVGGAANAAHGNGRDAGRVQIFAYNCSINRWKQIGQDLANESSHFYALDLSKDGTIAAVGAVWNDGTSGRTSMHVRVFSYDSDDDQWNQIGQDIDAESEYNGISVALSADGMIVAVRTNRYVGDSGQNSGRVQVFLYDHIADHWNQVGEDLGVEGDHFGSSVALSWDGTIVAAGASLNHGNRSDSGSIRVFELSTPPPYIAGERRGNNQARYLWSRGGYPCTNLDDIVYTFWPDVQTTVFPDCETHYSFWSDALQACKDGAEEFVLERVAECIDLTDCQNLGYKAAWSIANRFCDRHSYGGRGRFFPPTCEAIAKAHCKARVIDRVQTYANYSDCGDLTDVTDLTPNEVQGLMDECEDVVDDMSEKTSLPP